MVYRLILARGSATPGWCEVAGRPGGSDYGFLPRSRAGLSRCPAGARSRVGEPGCVAGRDGRYPSGP
jgi:hypothetical protein